MGKFLTELETRQLDDKNSVLLKPLQYRSEILGGILEVETGFISDGSSTPRVPFIYAFYGGRAHREGFVHDRLYRAPGHRVAIILADGSIKTIYVSKRTCDKTYMEAMIAREKEWYIRKGMYAGVYFGGFRSYRTGPERFKIIQI